MKKKMRNRDQIYIYIHIFYLTEVKAFLFMFVAFKIIRDVCQRSLQLLFHNASKIAHLDDGPTSILSDDAASPYYYFLMVLSIIRIFFNQNGSSAH